MTNTELDIIDTAFKLGFTPNGRQVKMIKSAQERLHQEKRGDVYRMPNGTKAAREARREARADVYAEMKAAIKSVMASIN